MHRYGFEKCRLKSGGILSRSQMWHLVTTRLPWRIYKELSCQCSVSIYLQNVMIDNLYQSEQSGDQGWGYERSMMTSSNGNIFRVTGPLCGEFTGPGEFPAQRPVTRSFDVFFDLRPNKRLSKQPWGWWFETPSRSLWRQCNAVDQFLWNGYFRYCLVRFFKSPSLPCEIPQCAVFEPGLTQ